MIRAATILAAEKNNPLIPHTYELVVGIFSFAVVVLVVGKILVPRIQKTLEERTDAIEGGLKRAEETQAKAQEAYEDYQAQLKEARHEASRLREQAREEGAQIIAQMREEAQAEARRIVAAAQTQIEAERQSALASLRGEVGAMSVELAGRVVGESLTDDARQSRVVDRFLEELEGRARSQEQITS
ncbi:F0F1 ATP synthase subunit B [Spirillospora sp. CA-294931]|uniref:F0F1 ATP synthase subunit B n=1 Tax=Spirillospora sp. CA-294931 TaxID=3240042 RepID=UPI003D8DA5BE